MKKVLILTAERTGTGHKSSANAVEKNLNKLGYETKQVDCFPMLGRKGIMMENSYIPMTTTTPLLFYIPYLISQKFPNFIHSLIYFFSKKKFKKEIFDYKPDMIITVHSMFTKSISRLLKKENLNIPFYVYVIDLVNPPHLWFDENADAFFVPTYDVKNDYLNKGIDEDKLIVSGFPIREDIVKRDSPKEISDKVNILLVNPSVNLKKNIRYAKEVSRLENVSISFICGRDKRLYKALLKEQSKGNINSSVHIFSFVTNMNEFLDNAHIVLTKAGPNMMLEATRSGSAVVVTGHIQGQENSNYEYITKNNYGFKCENPKYIYNELKDFISSGNLNNCLKNVLSADFNNGAEIVANYINSKNSI